MGSIPADIRFDSFPQGGIHPPDNKISAGAPIRSVDLPKQVILPFAQHIGVPAKPVVQIGDKVKVGQVIAEATSFVSANVHSSVSGTVKKIDDVLDVAGYKKSAIFIDVEGDEWLETIDRSTTLKTDISLEPVKILEKIRASGIVGMGGAAFPTHVKLAVATPNKRLPDFLLINGVECEPYLTSDHRLMLERANEIIVGIKLLMKATGITKALVGVEANKLDAVESLSRATEKLASGTEIEIRPLAMLYPQGGERQLVKALTGREIPPPPKGLPIDVGAVVVNVATAFAVYEAVQKNKPLVERVVTVTGQTVKSPGNFLVRFGTSVSYLLSFVGGIPEEAGKITSGGPMMGRAFVDLDTPLLKGMGGFVVYGKDAAKRGQVTNCIRCGKCVAACPLGLEPYLIAALTEKGNLDRAEDERIVNCCDCGCCAYVCPANRPLTDYIKLGKVKVLEKMKTRSA